MAAGGTCLFVNKIFKKLLFRMSEGGNGGEVQQLVVSDKAPIVRVVLTDSDISSLTAADWVIRWRQQESYVSALERRLAQQEGT